MTNTEIKEVIEILKKEGCNSKKQAIEYLEGKLIKLKIGDEVRVINSKCSAYQRYGKIIGIKGGNNYVYYTIKFSTVSYGGFQEKDLEVKE